MTHRKDVVFGSLPRLTAMVAISQDQVCEIALVILLILNDILLIRRGGHYNRTLKSFNDRLLFLVEVIIVI